MIATDENMANEEIIFDQLVKWIQYDELGRTGHAFELIQCIRLKYIPDKALLEKVIIFCQKYNIVGYTDNECKERLQNPRPLYLSRFAHTRSVFVIHEKGSKVIVRTYDPIRKCWRKEITIANELPQKFYGIVFCMEKLYIIGGCTENGKYLKDVDMFDFESKTCTDLPEMNVARGYSTAIAIDKFIYVFGGYNGITLKDCERFNTVSGKWEKRKPMHYAHHSLTAAAVNDYIFVADGISSNKGCCCKVECYDPINDEWTKIANLLDPMFEGILIEWKGFLYAVGINVERMKRYDCKLNIWVTPDIAGEKDEILSSFRRMRLINFDYSREKVIVERKNFFKRLCAPNSTEVILADFSHNLVLHSRSPL